jgi:hypothetical protein
MKVQRTSPEQLREMGYRWSEKVNGWIKVSEDFIQLEVAAFAKFWAEYEDFKHQQWLYRNANENTPPKLDDVGHLHLDEVLALFKDMPECPDIEFDLDPADYQEKTP